MFDLNVFVNFLNNQYLIRYNTRLVGGFNEPFYKTFIDKKSAEIQFSHDYIRSALHELSHWCVAGVERRNTDDYGYWYTEDGRNQQQQDEFFKLEVKPQTIEWALSIVCGVKFEASIDNLNNSVVGVKEFRMSLKRQMQNYLNNGFSKRTSEIIELLASSYQIPKPYEFISLKTHEL